MIWLCTIGHGAVWIDLLPESRACVWRSTKRRTPAKVMRFVLKLDMETQDTHSKGNKCFGDYRFHVELELVARWLAGSWYERERAKGKIFVRSKTKRRRRLLCRELFVPVESRSTRSTSRSTRSRCEVQKHLKMKVLAIDRGIAPIVFIPVGPCWECTFVSPM